jgi:hypothetical protein
MPPSLRRRKTPPPTAAADHTLISLSAFLIL